MRPRATPISSATEAEEVLEDLEGYGVYGHFSIAPGALGLDPLGDCSTEGVGAGGDVLGVALILSWPCPKTETPL